MLDCIITHIGCIAVRRYIAKYAIGTVALIFVILFWIDGYLSNEYIYNIRIPDPELGKVVPFHVKNIFVYITEEQWNFIYWLKLAEFATGSVAISAAFVGKINESP